MPLISLHFTWWLVSHVNLIAEEEWMNDWVGHSSEPRVINLLNYNTIVFISFSLVVSFEPKVPPGCPINLIPQLQKLKNQGTKVWPHFYRI